MGRVCYVELESIKFTFLDRTYKVRILLSLHEIGVGEIAFIFENIGNVQLQYLINLAFLHKMKYYYLIPLKLLSYSIPEDSKIKNRKENLMTLNDIFYIFLILLEDNGIKIAKKGKKGNSISENEYSLYSAVFVSDLGEKFLSPDEFIKDFKSQIFNIITARFHYKDCDFFTSRNDRYINQIFTQNGSNRRHVNYYITYERMTAFSTIKYHSKLYPYEFNWYFAYISMLCLVRMQFQILEKLYRTLYYWKIWSHPLDIVKLKALISHGLEEYYNIRFPIDIRTGEFIEHCKKAMRMDRLLKVIEDKISLISDAVIENYNYRIQERSNATSIAINILSLILAIPVVIQTLDKFYKNPPYYSYGVGWVIVAFIFWSVQRIAKKLIGKGKNSNNKL